MKQFLIIVLLFCSGTTFAKEKESEWNNTTLSEEVIKKIQQAQYHYKACVVEEMQKPAYSKQESRRATDEIIKKCETTLSKMRSEYLEAKVPETIADRHLRKIRIQITRKLLQELMFQEAARKAGNK